MLNNCVYNMNKTDLVSVYGRNTNRQTITLGLIVIADSAVYIVGSPKIFIECMTQ